MPTRDIWSVELLIIGIMLKKCSMKTVVQGQSHDVTFRSTVLAEGNIRSSITPRWDTK